MNKAYSKLERLLLSLFVVCLILFNNSCGLDTYIVMDDPVLNIIHEPEYSSIQFQENYFEFYTNETGNYPNDFMFLGTEVYYKIYNNYSIMNQERATLESLASDKDTASKAPDKLRYETNAGGYGYVPLKIANYIETPLIKASKPAKNQHIYIRLSDYQSDPLYASKITIDGSSVIDGQISKPVRSVEGYTFNFGRKGNNDKIPQNDTKDVKYSSFSEDHTWYVCLFAVAVGHDVSYLPYYSNVTYLGCVPIKDNTADN